MKVNFQKLQMSVVGGLWTVENSKERTVHREKHSLIPPSKNWKNKSKSKSKNEGPHIVALGLCSRCWAGSLEDVPLDGMKEWCGDWLANVVVVIYNTIARADDDHQHRKQMLKTFRRPLFVVKSPLDVTNVVKEGASMQHVDRAIIANLKCVCQFVQTQSRFELASCACCCHRGLGGHWRRNLTQCIKMMRKCKVE